MYPLIVRPYNKQVIKSFEKLENKGLCKTILSDIELLRFGLQPLYCEIEPLKSIDSSVIELKINGSPAYRCVYVIRAGELIILHVFKKTTNGPDKKNLKTTRDRFKLLN